MHFFSRKGAKAQGNLLPDLSKSGWVDGQHFLFPFGMGIVLFRPVGELPIG